MAKKFSGGAGGGLGRLQKSKRYNDGGTVTHEGGPDWTDKLRRMPQRLPRLSPREPESGWPPITDKPWPPREPPREVPFPELPVQPYGPGTKPLKRGGRVK